MFFCFLGVGGDFEILIAFLNEYGELDTIDTGDLDNESLGAAGEASGEGG